MATSRRKSKQKERGGKGSNENNDVIFPRGIIVFEPHEKAPDFVIAELVVSLDDFTKFAEENADLLHNHEKYGEQLKLTLKESKGGKLYLQVNDYKK